MNDNQESKAKFDKKKGILLAGACALVVGGGAYALVSKDQPEPEKRATTSSIVQPKKKNKKSTNNKKSKETGNSSSDEVLTDVFSTYDIPEITTPSSSRSSSRNLNTLSPSEISLVANTIQNREKENAKPAPVQTLVNSNPGVVNKEKENNKGTDKPIVVPIVPPTVDPEPPVVTPEPPKPEPEIPPIIQTTPSITVVDEPIKINEGEEFDPRPYFAVNDSGDKNPIISYSKNSLEVGRNEIVITAINKFGNSASAALIVILNSKPTLSANGSLSLDVSIHTTPDYRSFVSAWDLEDGDISNRIDVDGVADTDREGSYDVTYNVYDTDGAKASSLVLTFNVVNEAPVIHASDRDISLEDDLYDPLLGVSVTDMEDDRDGYPLDLTHVNILENTVDITTEGEYTITVGNIRDRDGKEAAPVTFVVKVTNTAPEISVPDYSMHVGDSFDLEEYRRTIVVSDKEDDRKGMIPDIEISHEDLDSLDTTQEGTYTLTITATDSHGKSTSIVGNVKVVAAEPTEPDESLG